MHTSCNLKYQDWAPIYKHASASTRCSQSYWQCTTSQSDCQIWLWFGFVQYAAIKHDSNYCTIYDTTTPMFPRQFLQRIFLTTHHIISIHACSSDQTCSFCIPSTHFLRFQHHKAISACSRQNYLQNHNYVACMISSKVRWMCTHCRLDAISTKSAKHYRECFAAISN
jgi:hypothetical protein